MEIRAIDYILKEKSQSKEIRNSSSFVQELSAFIHWVNEEQKKAKVLKEAVLRGEEVPLHQMVIEFEKANVALNLLIQIRNKLLEAYQELNRMQV
ncbi:MAG: flagellar hook-basal body complex protein FliE [Aquificaceae bacterium]